MPILSQPCRKANFFRFVKLFCELVDAFGESYNKGQGTAIHTTGWRRLTHSEQIGRSNNPRSILPVSVPHFSAFINRRIDMISTEDVRELIEHKAQAGSGVLSVYLNVDQSQAVNLNRGSRPR